VVNPGQGPTGAARVLTDHLNGTEADRPPPRYKQQIAGKLSGVRKGLEPLDDSARDRPISARAHAVHTVPVRSHIIRRVTHDMVALVQRRVLPESLADLPAWAGVDLH
jgi:hypothetical protein